jgi:hypothetical protein
MVIENNQHYDLHWCNHVCHSLTRFVMLSCVVLLVSMNYKIKQLVQH